MNNKIVGILMLVFGVVLVMWGYENYTSAQSQVMSSITGGLPIQALVGMIAGGLNIVVGISKLK